MSVTLRAASPQDAAFLERVFFATQRWMIEQLFGWRGDDCERRRLEQDHLLADAQIIVVDGRDAGWLIEGKHPDFVEIDGIYPLPEFQCKGIGSYLIGAIIREAETARLPVRLSVAKINPASRLYERLGFSVVGETEFKIVMERLPAAKS